MDRTFERMDDLELRRISRRCARVAQLLEQAKLLRNGDSRWMVSFARDTARELLRLLEADLESAGGRAADRN